jgi:hypothetical protein
MQSYLPEPTIRIADCRSDVRNSGPELLTLAVVENGFDGRVKK